jgi:D-alanyl-D-alanine carboxypeptidase
LSVRQAVLALITKSANDVAVVLAENIAGSETAFVARMNKEARRLGMISTHFCNASGLPHAQQISTARDMARLSRVLIYQYSKYYPLFSTKSFMYAGQTYPNHNALLGRTRNGVVIDGLKTGFVSASGFNLAASAVKGDRRLIVVVLGGPDRLWRDARVAYLFRYGFDGQFPGKPSLPRTRDIPQETVLQVFEKDDEIAHLIQSLDLSQPPRPARTKKPATRPKTRKLSKQHIVCVPVTQERPEVFLAHLKRRLPKKLLAQTSSQIKTSKRAKGSTVAFLCDNRKQALALHKALHKRGFQSIHQT